MYIYKSVLDISRLIKKYGFEQGLWTTTKNWMVTAR